MNADVYEPGGIRLQKALAQAGVGSRRHCEELIAAGRVSVDGRVVDRLGTRVDPSSVVIRVDGDRVCTQSGAVYLAVNKPRGVVSSLADEQGRPDLDQFVGGRRERLFHVGRLDADSEGLLLLTNDGELAHRLTHPSFGVPRTYLAEVDGVVSRATLRQLRAGVELDDGPVVADAVRVRASSDRRTLVELTLHEGRKHVVRRTLAAVGHPVRRLVRESLGPVQLGALRSGKTRRLTPEEVAALYRCVDL